MSLNSIIIGHHDGGLNQGSRIAIILVVLLLGYIIPFYRTSIVVVKSHDYICEFSAIYNFGDSNSDTGSSSAVFGRVPPPSGNTFFGEPSGRESDGRLIIDFLAGKLGLPYLDSYLDSIGTNFSHGANFAVSGSTIEVATGKIDAGFSPLDLSTQLAQFTDFKNQSIDLYVKKGGSSDNLPRPQDFTRALYTIDIGQNDLHYKLITFSLDQVLDSIPDLVNQTVLAIQKLYGGGARNFWIHNTGPLGCLPFFLEHFPPKPENTDEIGCIKSHNEVAQVFNEQLKNTVSQLHDQLGDAAFTYVDIYSAKYSLFKDAAKEGFVDPHGYCCKHPDNPNLRCWNVETVNGTSVYATSCSNPGEYISWDSIHFTEAANHWIADHILDGSLSTPPLPITKACISAE